MSKSNFWRPALVSGLLLTLATAGHAHPGHGADGFAQGLAHPFVGLDHLVAMLAVGLWSVLALPAARRWTGPATFVALLVAGAVLARLGVALPAVESGVAASVVLFGVLLMAARQLPAGVGLAVTAVAGLLHGYAHGSELAAGASFAVYAAGFVLGSALLHGAGLAAGTGLQRLPAWVARIAAALVGGTGLLLLAARI